MDVTEHVSASGAVPAVGGRWLPGPELAGVVVGQGRLGVGLLSLIAVLREELRLPIARHPVVSGGRAWAARSVSGPSSARCTRWRSGPQPVVAGIRESDPRQSRAACR